MVEETPPEEGVPVPSEEGEGKEKKLSPVLQIGLAIVGLTLLLLAGLAVLGALSPATLGILRDIAIVFLAILTFFSMILLVFLLAVLVWGIDRLSDRLDALLTQGEAVLQQVKGTATTVKGTADFVGERIASPFIWVAAQASAIGKGLATLFRTEKRTGGSQ